MTGNRQVTWREVERAAHDAVRYHMGKWEIQDFCREWEGNISLILAMLLDGSYVEHITYRKLEKTNRNGKRRQIDSPTLVTRILQYVFINRVRPLYDERDNQTGLNCKIGCGLNATDKRKSVRHRVKHLFYDCRDIHYVACIDQRRCYQHVKTKTFRKSLKTLTTDSWLVEYGCNVTMVDGTLPIGTPVSPLAHHIIMLGFDRDMACDYPFYVRYADNIMVGCCSKAEVSEAYWRIKQRWWYELGIRVNRWDSHIYDIDKEAVDFCGTVYHRNAGKGFFDHNKGYALIRRSTADAARKATPRNWGCYFGQLVGADTFHLIQSIESKNMKLSELTSKIKIDRKMDAPNVQPKDLLGRVVDIIDYEIRQNGKGQDNWVKLLIAYDEYDADGMATGRKAMCEMHGDYRGIHAYLRALERTYGGKSVFLPIEDAEIVNSCGYIFRGSTNQMHYIEDYAENINNI